LNGKSIKTKTHRQLHYPTKSEDEKLFVLTSRMNLMLLTDRENKPKQNL